MILSIIALFRNALWLSLIYFLMRYLYQSFQKNNSQNSKTQKNHFHKTRKIEEKYIDFKEIKK